MSENTQVTRPRLAAVNRRQLVMRTMDVELLIEEDHPARSIWELVGRLDLSRYYAEIGSVEGRAGRDHTDPQVLISLWLYAYSRGISSAREVARRCEYEPSFQWLCALEPISYHTLSDFRSDQKAALDNLFMQVLGMLSAEGRITLERVTLDGTKIKANAGGNTFRRQEKLEAHLRLAGEQVRLMEEQSAQEEQMTKRQVAARRRAARQRQSRLEEAVREVERMQSEKKEDRERFVARASSTDPQAHVMRNGEGGTGPELQRAIADRHRARADRECGGDHQRRRSPSASHTSSGAHASKPWDASPSREWPMATTPIMPRCRPRRTAAWTFMDRGKRRWKPGEHDAQGRSAAFLASAFPYDAERDCFTCTERREKLLTHQATQNREHGVRIHVYRAPKAARRSCALRPQCTPQKARPGWVQ